MDLLFQLPAWLGICVVVATIVILGFIVVAFSKRIISKKLNKKHERIGRLLFRVTAGLIALLLSLSYANERIEQNKLRDSMELEASLIVNVMIKLNIHISDEAKQLSKTMVEYIEFTLDDKWDDVKSNPFFSESSSIMVNAIQLAYQLPEDNPIDAKIKADVISEINQVSQLMQVRVYSQRTITPYLIYILFFGMLFMWVFYSVYDIDFISLSFLSLYNSFIAVLIYFVFMMSNPLVGELKMNHDSFKIIKEKPLFNGLSFCLLRAFIVNGVSFAIYEKL